MVFHQIFRICLPQDNLELLGFGGYPFNNCLPWQHFEYFLVSKCVNVSKPMLGFSPDFQDMLTERGFTAD